METTNSHHEYRLRLNNFIGNGPLTNLVFKQWRLRPWQAFLIVLAVGLVDELGIGFLVGHWRSTPGVVGVFDVNNIPMLLMSLVVEPGIWAFYVWLPPAVIQFFEEIRKRGIVAEGEEDLTWQLKRLSWRVNSNTFRYLALTVALGFTIFSCGVLLQYRPAPWFCLVTWHFPLGVLRTFLAVYVAVYSVLWSGRVMIALDYIFSRVKIHVAPYHGDNAGGLGFVGSFTASMSRLYLIMAPFLVAELFFALRMGRGIPGQINVIIEIIAMPVLMLISLVLPLTACRNAMVSARERELSKIGNAIHVRFEAIGSNSKPSKEDNDTLSGLIDLQARYRKDFPTLPFDVYIRQQYGAGFIITLIPVLIQLYQVIYLWLYSSSPKP